MEIVEVQQVSICNNSAVQAHDPGTEQRERSYISTC